MEGKNIVTIDLGTQKLGLSVATDEGKGQIKILCYNEFPSDGISRGKVLNPSKLGAALKRAVDDTERFLKLKINEAMVNIQKYDIREISVESGIDISEGRCITAEDIDNLENMVWSDARENAESGEDVLGVVAQSFDTNDEVSVGVKDIVGMVAEHLSGHYKAYLGRSSYHNNIEAAFNAAGVKVVRPVFIPARVGECVLTPAEMESGVALMDIGAGGSSVSVFYNGTMRHYGAIPFGGNSITGDIRNLCGIDEHLAENIKMGYGGLMPDKLASLGEKTLKITDIASGSKVEITAKYLSEIITARTREILDALLYEIQLSGYADKLKNGVVVVGGCANTLNICNMIKEISGYNARVGAPSRKKFDADSSFFTAGASASAGLILQFMGEQANACTELAEETVPESTPDLTELFTEQPEPQEPQPKPAKPSKPQKAPKEPRRPWARSFETLLFGPDDDEDNKI
ncbi:MAG: cell division protein FtsA [Bacteroidales bacterium]|nr:cell division protein FtsA [Bacteroidales bacterium]